MRARVIYPEPNDDFDYEELELVEVTPEELSDEEWHGEV